MVVCHTTTSNSCLPLEGQANRALDLWAVAVDVLVLRQHDASVLTRCRVGDAVVRPPFYDFVCTCEPVRSEGRGAQVCGFRSRLDGGGAYGSRAL